MKFIDEYRDPALVKGLLDGIRRRARQLDRPVTLMEVCGTHTMAIGRYGLRALLPAGIKLVSGPGCPVCVTAVQDVDHALALARLPEAVLATFGDMLRVPGSGGTTLQNVRAEGADIRVVGAATDCLALAAAHPDRPVVFMGIGFETTSPTIAAMLTAAQTRKITNLSVLSTHKLLPPAVDALINDPELAIDGFLCPGHVSTIIGADAYRPITDAGLAAVITGVEPVDVLEGVFMLLGQIRDRVFSVDIQYARGVKAAGNRRALDLLDRVFQPADARWRGLGTIPGSGLDLRPEFAAFDARRQHRVQLPEPQEPAGCRCGDILRGIILPADCPLFRTVCSPLNPVGPCMVSSEGTCAAYYKYH